MGQDVGQIVAFEHDAAHHAQIMGQRQMELQFLFQLPTQVLSQPPPYLQTEVRKMAYMTILSGTDFTLTLITEVPDILVEE